MSAYLWVGVTMHASSDYIREDNKDGTFHLHKGHKPQKR